MLLKLKAPLLHSVPLYVDVSTTMIVKPGPVVEFLLMNQKVDNPGQIDWSKVIKLLWSFEISYAVRLVILLNFLFKTGKEDLKESKDQGFQFKSGIQDMWVEWSDMQGANVSSSNYIFISVVILLHNMPSMLKHFVF